MGSPVAAGAILSAAGWHEQTTETEDDVTDEGNQGTTPEPDDPPVVLSPGDSDAPDAPDPETIYPDEQGVPGEPAD